MSKPPTSPFPHPRPSSSASPPPGSPATFILVPVTPHCLHAGGDPCTPRSRPEGCREPRLHSEWRVGREELGCHFFLVKRKGRRSGAGGRWERGKGNNPGRISGAPRPWKNSKPFYAEGAAATLASHSSLRADRGRKFCGRGMDPPVVPSGVR